VLYPESYDVLNQLKASEVGKAEQTYDCVMCGVSRPSVSAKHTTCKQSRARQIVKWIKTEKLANKSEASDRRTEGNMEHTHTARERKQNQIGVAGMATKPNPDACKEGVIGLTNKDGRNEVSEE